MLRLGVYAIVIAVPLAVLVMLPARVTALIVAGVVGAAVVSFSLVTSAYDVTCDFARVQVDRCSGTYVTVLGVEHRLPQFMQGERAMAWLLAGSAVVGATAAVLVMLAVMWTWTRVRRPRVARA